MTEARLDYFQTIQLLDGWAGEMVLVTPAPSPPEGAVPSESELGLAGMQVTGRLISLGSVGAEGRRELSEAYERIRPELALGDAPLEQYERQVAHYTFEGMSERGSGGGRAGFAVWQHEFIEACLIPAAGSFEWLWLHLTPVSLFVARGPVVGCLGATDSGEST